MQDFSFWVSIVGFGTITLDTAFKLKSKMFKIVSQGQYWTSKQINDKIRSAQIRIG